MDKPSGYSRAQIALHWIIAALIVMQYVFHEQIETAWLAIAEGKAEAGFQPHALFGMVILGLAIWRLILRLRRGAPDAPDHGALINKAGKATHHAIYALIFLIPLSGMGAWFGGIGFAAGAHGVMTKLLLVLVILHIGAAIYHQYVLKDGLIKRMMKAG